jgi:hypothetical protein
MRGSKRSIYPVLLAASMVGVYLPAAHAELAASVVASSGAVLSPENAAASGAAAAEKAQSFQPQMPLEPKIPSTAQLPLVPVTPPPSTGTEPVLQATPVAPEITPESSVSELTPSAAAPLPPALIVIDNDEDNETAQVQTTYNWAEMPDSPGKTRITTGARFPVKVVSELSSKTAKAGDIVEAVVRIDIKIGGRMVAPKGTRVVGHVFNVMPARRILMAELSLHRWWRANGEIGVQFDQMITAEGEHIPLDATPTQQSRIVINKAEGRVMGVNAKGEVASPLSIQLKDQAIQLAIRGAASAAGVFSFGAVPVAYACIGAINPSFAFMHPVGMNVHHRRLKGAGMGLVSGLPGGFLIADSIIKGSEAVIKPGDEFLVSFKQDFTGEPATDAELMAGGTKNVHAELVGRHKKKGK